MFSSKILRAAKPFALCDNLKANLFGCQEILSGISAKSAVFLHYYRIFCREFYVFPEIFRNLQQAVIYKAPVLLLYKGVTDSVFNKQFRKSFHFIPLFHVSAYYYIICLTYCQTRSLLDIAGNI